MYITRTAASHLTMRIAVDTS